METRLYICNASRGCNSGIAFHPQRYSRTRRRLGNSSRKSACDGFGQFRINAVGHGANWSTDSDASLDLRASYRRSVNRSLDEVYLENEPVLVEYTAPDGKPAEGTLRGRYRLGIERLLAVAFAVLLILTAGWTGAKALLSFVLAIVATWRVLLPSILKGNDPILIALIVIVGLSGAIHFMVGGLSKRGLVAFLGCFLGVGLTALLALLFWKGFRVHGAVRPFSETLLYAGYGHLNLTRVFLAGVFLAASGAIMDLSMDIAAAMDEIVRKIRDIGRLELLRSGLRVGRAVLGTMTTTLLFAYSANYLNMMMLFMAQGVPLENVMNHNYVAAEILQILVGSFGLVTVAPFTALVGCLLYKTTRAIGVRR